MKLSLCRMTEDRKCFYLKKGKISIYIIIYILSVFFLGDFLELNIERSSPALGTVTAEWLVVAIDGSDDPSLRFNSFSGSIIYAEVRNKYNSRVSLRF